MGLLSILVRVPLGLPVCAIKCGNVFNAFECVQGNNCF